MGRLLLARLVLSLALALAVLVPALSVSAQTNPFAQACSTGKGGDSAVCGTTGGDPVSKQNGILHKATQLVAIMAGVAAVLTMVWAGIQYITSEGNPEAVSKAKKTIIFAAIGLVVIIAAQSIINFVLNRI